MGVAYQPPELDIVLPVGISFYTFQTLSYTLDVYLRRGEPHHPFLDYALYVSFFPQLVAGPIWVLPPPPRKYGEPAHPPGHVGASRINAGFDPDVFDAAHPRYEAIMLAIPARGPAATLHHLAEDEDFTGVALVSMAPYHFLRKLRNQQRGRTRTYDRLVDNHGYLNVFANRRISALSQERLVYLNPNLDLGAWASARLAGQPGPAPYCLQSHADYSRSAHYDMMDAAAHRKRRLRRQRRLYRSRSRAPSPQAWLKQTRPALEDARKIIAHGGQVVFVRYITTGALWRLDQRAYPRERYWDAFARQDGVTAIHFADDARTRDFVCPDGSHLDARDTARDTLNLAEVLVERGVLTR